MSQSLNAAKLYVTARMNELQDEHSKLITALQARIGQTKECDDAIRVLSQVYDAQIALLDEVYKELDR